MNGIGMLVAYDAGLNIIATMDYLVVYDETKPERPVKGLVDWAALEEAAREMTEVWNVSGATGSKVWIEWIGGRALDFRVELSGPPGKKFISALVHKVSGHRRELLPIALAIKARIDAAGPGGVADIRDLVGGPDRPIRLNYDGTNATPAPPAAPVDLPLIVAPDV